jgi:hypothetical protein
MDALTGTTEIPVIGAGAGMTINPTPAAGIPATETTTGPEVAPIGTAAVMILSVQVSGVASMPLNVTVPEVPKLEPVMVTTCPTSPAAGDSIITVGAVENCKALVVRPAAMIVTEVVPGGKGGTCATTVLEFQFATCALIPLNWTLLEPWVFPSAVPEIESQEPTLPEVADKLPRLGLTVNAAALLEVEFAVTIADPSPGEAEGGTCATMVVEVQLVIWASAPPMTTEPVIEDCEEPKPEPVMVTDVPAIPEVGERPVMPKEEPTVKPTPFDASPPTVSAI